MDPRDSAWCIEAEGERVTWNIEASDEFPFGWHFSLKWFSLHKRQDDPWRHICWSKRTHWMYFADHRVWPELQPSSLIHLTKWFCRNNELKTQEKALSLSHKDVLLYLPFGRFDRDRSVFCYIFLMFLLSIWSNFRITNVLFGTLNLKMWP